MAAQSEDKARARILRLLLGGPAGVSRAASGAALLDAGERGAVAVSRRELHRMAEQGLVERRGEAVSLSATGLAYAARLHGAADAFQNQHRDLDHVTIEGGDGPFAAVVNLAESPLGQLVRRKSRDGKALLNAAEFEAGERLRADYTRGQIMPRLGANWEASVASGRRNGGGAELTDAALAARQRVDAAIAAVGPELAGVLIDVCCFLKGLELVEMEREWPARSAKLMLRTALAALARHYNPPAAARPRTLHWGAEDYRPNLAV